MSSMNKISRREFIKVAGLSSTAALLAACAPAATPTEAPKPNAASPTALAEKKPGSLPIVSSPMNFSYWLSSADGREALVKNINEVLAYAECEKRTGIHIDWQVPAANQGAEQFNLMLASGKYPDIIEASWLGQPGGPAKFLKDKVILRLNELIDQYAPNFKKVLADNPEWRKMIMTDEGDIYCFPMLRGDPFLLTFGGPILRADWLQKLKLEVPTTVDEWHTVLKAFKEQDPNGNGKADEVAFSPAAGNSNLYAYRYHTFIGAWGITLGFYNDGGKVKYGPAQPEFKEFLKTMAAWYKEGLIDTDFMAADAKLLDAKITGDQLGGWVGNAGGNLGRLTTLMQGKEPASFKLVGTTYPVLKKGDKPQFGQRDFAYVAGYSAAITSACKNVKEAVQWLDYKYSDEGHMLFMFGVDGVTYKMVNGYPTYTELITKNPDGLPMGNALPKYVTINGPLVQDKRYFEQFLQFQQQRDAVKSWSDFTGTKVMPLVTPTQDESKKISSVMNDINTRFDEAVAKVLTGADPVENWDKVIDQINKMGLEDAIKINQAALERYSSRK